MTRWDAIASRFNPRPDRGGAYESLRLTSPSGRHVIEITESPTGKTIHVFVDHKRWDAS